MSNLAKQYQRKSDKQHVLDNPDTYIGSVEIVDTPMWIYDNETNKITTKTMQYIPGLYKLFDEGVVNCRDHVIRMLQNPAENKKVVSYIETEISEDGTITLTNDGNGIDVAKHPEYDLWIPEMIFGHLRTSTNYDKTEEKIVGGKNGFGFKLVLIWSTYGYIETVDHIRGLKYTQEFKNNLEQICPPTITKVAKSTKPYTKVVFRPDYARFRLPQGLSADMRSLMKKRVYDIAAVTDHTKKIRVAYNGEQVPIKNFQQYVDLYVGTKDEAKRIYESPDERWEYAVALSSTREFQQVSFVNGICTFKGGKHVDYILGQITRKMIDYIESKKKVRVHANSIKEQLILFLRCDIVNPAFDSQTKDYMNTPSNKFGSTCSISDSFIEKAAKMGIMDLACSITELKDNKMAAKQTDGVKTKTVRGIENYVNANMAGTEESHKCTLILCEGLSAMAGIMGGLTKEDRDYIGIYPLKGKLLNVRGETDKKIAENAEITDIKKILGLENGRQYRTIEDVNRGLRYSKVMVMTDQDADGSHIKGLCINLFHSKWQSLLRIDGFLSFMNTPILKGKNGSKAVEFYNEGEYNVWKQTLGDRGIAGWEIKYFKGLGTSTSKEFKEYFKNKRVVDFIHGGESDAAIDKVFNKDRADDRKTWLENYNKNAFLDTSCPRVSYEQFVDNELIHFSTYDCARSIPNMVDGLKTSLRKILYCAFKRNLKKEIKVAQLMGYVSEHSAYHHGEMSLKGAIINMAQTFVGSNNINLLKPNGQFGTRVKGGKDAASERYTFTQLNALTRYIFPETDDYVLNYLDDDGTRVEPEFYVPIIPFALVNGISGIGTGFSCSIPPFNPTQLVAYLKNKLVGYAVHPVGEFTPYYEGFKGTVAKIGDSKYLIKGCYEKVGPNKIRITELPVGTWTMNYYDEFIEKVLMEQSVDKDGKKTAAVVKDARNMSTEVDVDITLEFNRGVLDSLLVDEGNPSKINPLEKLLKLTTTVSTTNIHMFNADIKLHKYNSVEEVIDEFYVVRLETYRKRKQAQLDNLERDLVKLSNRAKYILENLDGSVDLRKKKKDEVNSLLESKHYAKIDGDYNYLVKMPMDSVTQENVDQILKEKADLELEVDVLKKTSEEEIWTNELVAFEDAYEKYKVQRAIDNSQEVGGGEEGAKTGTVGGAKKRIVRKQK
jgi:DNA topoisomerase-2